MRTVTVTEFRHQLGSLIGVVSRTQRPLLITKRGKPFVKVVPMPDSKFFLGRLEGKMHITGDIESPVVPADAWEVLRRPAKRRFTGIR